MKVFPNSLKGLLKYDQFILCDHRSVPVSTSGTPVNAHDPVNWLPGERALSLAHIAGLNVAFVFTAEDPFFFVDLDNCYQEGAWSTLAITLCRQFAGCAVEVSRSGNGLHIIGSYTECPEHKNRAEGIELYTSKRICRLTGTHARGDVSQNASVALSGLISTYFNPLPGAASVEWTSAPCAEWDGPTDDVALIKRARRTSTASSTFGSGVSFEDLWVAEPGALGRRYASVNGAAFDHSAADAALVAHLAFWTGRNCERIDTLFRQSALFRDKWDREDYSRRTILNAVARCKTVCTRLGASGASGASVKIMPVANQDAYFQGCTYVIGAHRVLVPGGHMLRPEQFKATYGGHIFMMDSINDKTSRNAWEVLTESRAITFPKVNGTCFRPEIEPGAVIEEEGYKLVNVWAPIKTVQVQGDVTPFLKHLALILPAVRDQAILLAYMSACVQYPGKKFQWAPLLQGCEGNGKTLFINCLSHAIGHRYTHIPNASDLGGTGSKFNAWLQNKLFIGVNEIHIGDKREVSDALKPLITDTRVEMQAKGQDQVTGDNRANFFLCTNPKDSIIKHETDRRYCVFYTDQQNKNDMIRAGWLRRGGEPTIYFKKLYDWLNADGYAIVNWYLRQYKIPESLNPATLCNRAPNTSSTSEVLGRSTGPIEQEIIEAIEENRPGFAKGWVSSIALNRLLESIGAARIVPRNRRREMLESLGYEPHPGLPLGRTTRATVTDGGKTTLYIQCGHRSSALTYGVEITRTYDECQTSV